MRLHLIVIALLIGTAVAAHAQPAERPQTPAPAATASFEQREAWCEQYATWLIAQVPVEGTVPADVRPTQRFEDEFNSCKPNPQTYERQTQAELAHAAQRS